MVDASFLPTLSSLDVDRATQAYGQPNSFLPPDELRLRQQELFEIQKRPEAWGLVLPLLNHEDPNVQFFGAHTVQVKIARDWLSFPEDQAVPLRDLLTQLTAHSIVIGRNNVILRKLFVSLCSLALKLAPQHPTQWPDWILSCVTAFSGSGAQTGPILDFLSIVAEEVSTADLLGPNKTRMVDTMKDGSQIVLQAIRSSLDRSSAVPANQVLSAMKCFQSWLLYLGAADVIAIIPLLLLFLNPEDDTLFIAASATLQEIMSSSPLSNGQLGTGVKTLAQPLLLWLDSKGSIIVENTLRSGLVDEVSHSLCKLLAELGDHSTPYFARSIASKARVDPLEAYQSVVPNPSAKTKGQLTQRYLRVMLDYTGLSGYFGADEETSELTLGFWYMLQEALWDLTVYVELVKILRRKTTFPPRGHGWSKDQIIRFQTYRRDIGDTLINAYYVIRDEMLIYFVDSLIQELSNRSDPNQGWEEIESTLHCLSSLQEALDYDKAPDLARLFNPEVIGRLPSAGRSRVRLTTLNLLGTYSSWFAHESPQQEKILSGPSKLDMLLSAVGYVVAALPEPTLSVQAALALRNLCDANRKLLAPQIGAFAELHAGLARVPDAEKSKVLQSIASVIEALPPAQQIPPIEAMATPIVQKLMDILNSPTTLPPEARSLAILQLETLAGISKGLTRATDDLLDLNEESEVQQILEQVNLARRDDRMARLREAILAAISRCVEATGQDVGVGQVGRIVLLRRALSNSSQAINELVKSITSLASDATIISLPPAPLLSLVCMAAERQLTASWLALATMLFAQMNPPPPMPLTGDEDGLLKRREAELERQRAEEEERAKAVVIEVLPILLNVSLSFMAAPGAMENVAQDFTATLYHLPPGALDALMQCSVRAMALQERYSLIAACNFLSNLIHRSCVYPALEAQRTQLISGHGRDIMRAVLFGLAGVSPRSATPNLVEMLSTLLVRCVEESRVWLKEILFDADFLPSKAGPAIKETFVKTVLGSRSIKRTREAANQFALVARGLEGTSFGYASVSM
ncbi:armadillo-type protein [Armillaria luteobubalina]|uniref:Armadillo-type protein n=1 Tax=Armillaria luteobubalina TaxID=153913 RepID=A0AA39UV91_9AGAR|nr:armadillo-type protein [Armillaria luteobubalina]